MHVVWRGLYTVISGVRLTKKTAERPEGLGCDVARGSRILGFTAFPRRTSGPSDSIEVAGVGMSSELFIVANVPSVYSVGISRERRFARSRPFCTAKEAGIVASFYRSKRLRRSL